MADFEGLIRQALARQDASDPAAREKVYLASRNALARMIAAGSAQPPSVIQQQRKALEFSIRKIEAEYRADPAPVSGAPQTETSFERGFEPSGQPDPRLQPPHERPLPAAEDELFLEEVDLSDHGVTGSGRRMVAIAAILVLLAVIGWLLYWLVVTIGTTTGSIELDAGPSTAVSDGGEGDLLTILSPVNTSSLQTAGRGTAELISESNTDMIRLTSTRSKSQLELPAEPITINLSSGVIEQIAGQRVTLEMLARSGSSGPATFSIHCDLGGVDACGRKRFRVGLQPEAIVFAINVPSGLSEKDNPYFAINTDVTGTAELTGKGDPVDIVHARLRLSDS